MAKNKTSMGKKGKQSRNYEDEINLQDIQFVLWINMMRMRKGNIINPGNPVLHEMAVALYAFLESEFEEGYMKHVALKSFFGEERGHQLLQDNISFLATYMRQEPT